MLRRGRGERQPGATSAERDLIEHVSQVGFQPREVAVDRDRWPAVHALTDTHLTEHMLGAVVEVGVDLRPLPVQADRSDRLPQLIGRRYAVFAAAQDEQIGHHVGARRAPMRPGGESDRAHEVGEHRHLPARAGVLRIHRVLRRQYGDHPAGSGEPQALENEVIVHRLPGRVVHRVVQAHVGERHVPDRRVERPLGQSGVGERLAAHLGVRVQGAADRRGHRVEFHPGHARLLGGHAEERAQPGAGFQHPAAVEAERGHGPPHLPHDQRVGVVRVDRRARSGIPLFRGEQAP